MNQVRRQRRNASQQAKLLEQWSKSGESEERFATRVGVTPATLKRWRKSMATEPVQDVPVVRAMNSKARPESMFARVQVVEPPSLADGLVEVVMRDGIMLRIHGMVDADTMDAVLGALSRC